MLTPGSACCTRCRAIRCRAPVQAQSKTRVCAISTRRWHTSHSTVNKCRVDIGNNKVRALIRVFVCVGPIPYSCLIFALRSTCLGSRRREGVLTQNQNSSTIAPRTEKRGSGRIYRWAKSQNDEKHMFAEPHVIVVDGHAVAVVLRVDAVQVVVVDLTTRKR